VSSPSLQSSFRVSDDVVTRELDGEAIILNLASGVYFGLDPVGTRMWQLIAERARLQDVLDAVREEYDAPVDIVAADLLRLVDDLLGHGLVTPADEAARPS
jgi:coenzyme PQQ synthesis protein D (PqqD)